LTGAIKCLEVKGWGGGFEWGGEKEQGAILHLSVVGFKKSIDDLKIYRLQNRFNTRISDDFNVIFALDVTSQLCW
jgi:hypothetical protein